MKGTKRIAMVPALLAVVLVSSIAAAPAVPAQPNQPTVAATSNGGELRVTWNPTAGTNFYAVGWTNWTEYQEYQNDDREWLDAFHFVTVPARYTSHTIKGLEPGGRYYVILAARTARDGGDVVWSPWSNLVTTAGQHGPGICPITGLPIPEGGYLEVGDTQTWTDFSFELTSATTPQTLASGGRVYAPHDGDRYLRLCGTVVNRTGGNVSFLAAYDNNLSTDAGIGFVLSTDGADWLEIGLISNGETASSCDTWVIPEAANTAVYAVYDTASEAVLYRVDLTGTSAAASPSTGTSTGSGMTTVASQQHMDQKRFMLDLINAERATVDAEPVALGDNVAAQLHAEDSIENCFASHWGTDGLKPYMRYSLAGGYENNAENTAGISYCIQPSDGYAPIADAEREMRGAMDVLMDSPGHRATLLDPYHRKVNIGVAWSRYNFTVVQQFEGDHFSYDQLPSISGGILTFSGSTRNGAQIAPELAPQIYFDAPPEELNAAQLARTFCVDIGPEVAGLRPPLPPGYSYDDSVISITQHEPCPNPYEVPAGALPPRSPEEARRLWNDARIASLSPPLQIFTFQWITADELQIHGDTISAKADLNHLLDRHGPGVYTLRIWGTINEENVVVSAYSIFHKVEPPGGYD